MARKKREEEHENHERWLVSYADFITLLFAFFTVLYATSIQDPKKGEEFEKSIRKYFSGFFGFGQMGDFHTDDDAKSLVPPPIDFFPPMGKGPAEVADYVKRDLERKMSDSEYKEAVNGIRHDTLGVHLSLAASTLFPSGSDLLRPQAASALDKIGRMLKDSKRKIVVEGHTDDQPISSARFASNWDLAAARATRIVRYLAHRHDVPEKDMVVVAYGDQKPVAKNDSEEGRAKNRRIEIQIITSFASPY